MPRIAFGDGPTAVAFCYCATTGPDATYVVNSGDAPVWLLLHNDCGPPNGVRASEPFRKTDPGQGGTCRAMHAPPGAPWDESGALDDAGLHASEDVVRLGRIDLGQRLEARHQAQRECIHIDAECELMAIHHINLEGQSDLPLQGPDEPLQWFIRRALQLLRGGAGLSTSGRKPEEQLRRFVAPRYAFDVFTCAELTLNPVCQRHRVDGGTLITPS